MKSWVQTHVHEFVYLVVCMMHISVYVCTYGVRKAYVGTYQPTILSHNNVLTCGTIGVVATW